MIKNISEVGPEYKILNGTYNRSFFCTLGIIVTNRCNIGCRHCICDCNPFSTKTLNRHIIRDIIEQAAKLDNLRSIAFSGGEPFLEYDCIIESVALCEMLGLEASVTTNGFWATTLDTAMQKMKMLCGLNCLNVSTDIFHQEYIPVDRVRNIIQSCHELDISCLVSISYLNNPVSEIKAIKEQLKGLEDLCIIKPQPISPLGRAAKLIDRSLIYRYDPAGIPCYGADNPVVEANGDVSFCCGGLHSHPGGSPLKIGSIHYETLEQIKRSADLSPIVQILRLRGPSGLVHLVRHYAEKEELPFIPPKKDELDLCSLCKYIVTYPNFPILLQHAVRDADVFGDIALTRLHELGEVSMLYQSV